MQQCIPQFGKIDLSGIIVVKSGEGREELSWRREGR
jgi:hypothetical protein